MAAEGSTILGKSIRINGEIIGSEDVIVLGKLEGTLTLKESRLTVGPDAIVKAAPLNVQDIIISGQVDGDVESTGRVELRKGATLTGNVTAARLSIEDGAAIKGKVTLSGATE